MYYDYLEEEFYPESEYQEQIDALKEVIKSSVKSEILEEMNRLRAENEKLQGIKEHFEEVKKDYEKKKDECDRIIRNAEYNAKKMRLADLMKDHKVIKWKVSWELVYGPKCDKCDSDRAIEIKLPSGKIVKDSCKCKTDSKRYYYPKRYVLSEFTDRNGVGKITALYSEEGSRNAERGHEKQRNEPSRGIQKSRDYRDSYVEILQRKTIAKHKSSHKISRGPGRFYRSFGWSET